MHLNLFFCKMALLFFLAVFALISPLWVVADQGNDSAVRLVWSCGALMGQGNEQRLIAIDKPTVLQTGDQLKFYFEPQTECYIYLFYYSSQGELHLLFPTGMPSSRLSAGTRYYIPSGKTWFELDDETGIEKFYLLASVTKLVKLESLYRQYLKMSDPADITASIASIFSEIKRLKRQHRTLSTVAERPARIGGNFRSVRKTNLPVSKDISQLAREISSTQYYGRTFTIDHQ